MATMVYEAKAGSPETYQSTAESMADFGTGPAGKAAYWKAEIHACNKELEKWRNQATKVVLRYRDDRGNDSGLAGHAKKYNMLWSIVRTTMPAIYGKPPKPIVIRRYTDPDNIARVASMILERCLEFQISNQSSFHPAIKNSLQDRLLPGMGQAWVRYQEGQESPTGTTDNDYYARLSGKIAAVDHIYWEDFGFIPARTWEEVPAVWRIVYMNKDQLTKRFGKDIANITPLDYVPARHPNSKDSARETDEPKHEVFKQAKIYEIWDKRDSTVTWISLGVDRPLDQKKDPTGFPGFFPCPKPLFATNTTGNLVPVPDYCMYQDQANEIDNLTQRLDLLTKALKVVGVYDSSNMESIGRMLTEAVENQLIPVDTWAAFAERGGVKGQIEYLPIDIIIEVVGRLFEIRQQLIQDIYQITGLSDIIRGASNPNETLGAQKIKAQFASVRLSELQQELARFVTDILRLMGHILVSFFDDKTLVEQSAILQSPDGKKAIADAQMAMQQRAQQAMQQMPQQPGAPQGMPQIGPAPGVPNVIEEAIRFLKRGQLIDYRIEVASDSMIEADLDAERDARNAFLTAVTQFLQQAIPGVQAEPRLLPVLQALLMFGVRGFRVGRDVEGIIESAFQQMQNEPQQEKPDPKMQALQAKAQIDAQKAQSDAAAKQAQTQADMQKMQAEMGMKMQELQATLQADRERNAAEIQAIREKTQAEIQGILIKAFVDAQVKRDKMEQDAQEKAVDVQASLVEHEQNLDMQRETHQQTMELTHEQREQEKADKDENS